MLRNLVRDNVPRYMAARTKNDKGVIIIDILESVRRNSPSGAGLVRQNPDTGRWSYIGNEKARDKIGHALRRLSRDFMKGEELLRKVMAEAMTNNSDSNTTKDDDDGVINNHHEVTINNNSLNDDDDYIKWNQEIKPISVMSNSSSSSILAN